MKSALKLYQRLRYSQPVQMAEVVVQKLLAVSQIEVLLRFAQRCLFLAQHSVLPRENRFDLA